MTTSRGTLTSRPSRVVRVPDPRADRIGAAQQIRQLAVQQRQRIAAHPGDNSRHRDRSLLRFRGPGENTVQEFFVRLQMTLLGQLQGFHRGGGRKDFQSTFQLAMMTVRTDGDLHCQDLPVVVRRHQNGRLANVVFVGVNKPATLSQEDGLVAR